MAKKAKKKDNRKFKVVKVPVRGGEIEALQVTQPATKLFSKQDLLRERAEIDVLLSKFPE
jgi:hypothetical protein